MAKTRLYKTVTFLTGKYKGLVVPIYYSDNKTKKYEIEIKDKTVRFGAKGYTIQPGKKRGQNYCTRSFGINDRTDIYSPNFWSGVTWRCDGRRSMNNITFETPLGLMRLN